MLLMAPDYYPHFRCIADRCRHTCCQGWEIDVDDAARAAYAAVTGPLAQRLHDALVVDDDGAHFRLDEQERCPFLNQNGLCDLITGLGEDRLCQICADHPRFRSFFTDRTEIGLGLCCEEAARLVLTWPTPVQLIAMSDAASQDDDAPDAAEAEEKELRQFRAELTAIMQQRHAPLSQRLQAMSDSCGCSVSFTPAECAAALLPLERLDPTWTAELERLQTMSASIDLDAAIAPWAVPMEQWMVYLLYRHMPAALEDGDAAAHVLVCCLLWHALAWLLLGSDEASMARLIDLARMISAEVEYSTDNLDALLDMFI